MITIISHSSTLVTFEWSPPPTREVNGFVRYYTVQLRERQSGREWDFIAVDSHINIGSLHPYYHYDFTVAAYTIGRGPFSNVYTVLTDENVPSGAPQEISAIEVTSTTLTLTWYPPQFEDTNGIIRYYRVHILEVETRRVFELTSNMTSVNVYELHPYYTYECRIAAFTVALGPYSNVFTVQLAEEG
jgi:receptor-type tyrosine-protein phosphatase Q